MKKTFKLLPLLPTLVGSVITISSCSCTITIGYVPIPSRYLNITDDGTYLNGFSDPELDLSQYDTLQVPTSVIKVGGFSYREGDKSYKCIQKILGDNSGKWTTIEDGAFSALPELTKVTLPKTIKSIGDLAFNNLYKLNTIDLSNLDDVSFIKSSCFGGSLDPSLQVNDGTIIVKSNDHANTLNEKFKDNEWLSGWKYKVK